MIAMLGMYDMPSLQSVNDRFWHAIRTRLGNGPKDLTRDIDVWDAWLSPDLLLAQTCGYPFRACLHGHVTYVTTPDYDLPGCPPGHYQSHIVVRAGDSAQSVTDLNGYRFAYNEALSQSGWAAPMVYLSDAHVSVKELVQTGAHRASALSVIENRADFAAIDAQTWRLLLTHDDAIHGLRVLASTPPTPGLPLITAKHGHPAQLRTALSAALDDLAPADRTTLGLSRFVEIPVQAYLSVRTPAPPTP